MREREREAEEAVWIRCAHSNYVYYHQATMRYIEQKLVSLSLYHGTTITTITTTTTSVSASSVLLQLTVRHKVLLISRKTTAALVI